MAAPREITLTIRLAGGDTRQVSLQEGAPELAVLFGALANRNAENQLVQLPLAGGRVAWSFQTANLVSIESHPPVVLEPPRPGGARKGELLRPPSQAMDARDERWRDDGVESGPTLRLCRPRFFVVDDFLSVPEHDELLAYALFSEAHFQAGTVSAYEPGVRQNQAILNFQESVHSRLLENRLLIWLPLLGKILGTPIFPLAAFESQLTAAKDGYYFKTHTDEAADIPRLLTCIYYLHRQPRGFAGGELRLYDRVEAAGARTAAETFTAIAPLANRLVVFPSDELHEALPVRCPSGAFADSRFAVTMWFHRGTEVDPRATFGWGHFSGGATARRRRVEGEAKA